MTGTDLGKLLRHKRKFRGLQIEQLSEITGVHRNTISKYEAGLGLDTLCRYVELLRGCHCELVWKVRTCVTDVPMYIPPEVKLNKALRDKDRKIKAARQARRLGEFNQLNAL